MDLAQAARALLEGAGYRVTAAVDPQIFYFEDESLFGFVWACDSVSDLLTGWLEQQDSFLIRQAERLRQSPRKSWNAYCVCLTTAQASDKDRHELLAIEEDFRGARKIGRADVNTVEDLRQALLPLTAIQNVVQLESIDALGRLRSKLTSEIPADCVSGLLSEMSLEELRELFFQANANPRNQN